jgi:hypothetical protein
MRETQQMGVFQQPLDISTTKKEVMIRGEGKEEFFENIRVISQS